MLNDPQQVHAQGHPQAEQPVEQPLFQPAYDPQKNRITPPKELAGGYWFMFHKSNLLLPKGSIVVPESNPYQTPSDPSWALPYIQRIYYFGTLNGKPCWAAYLDPPVRNRTTQEPTGSHSASSRPSPSLDQDFSLPPSWEAVNLRMAYGRLSAEELQAARFASHLLFWDRNTRFCGVCGAPTTDKPDERAKLCTDPSCNAVFYPKISPAVIVAILDKDRILLAHNRRFVSKFYSLIAGFVEIGESLEDCVHREVREEVGVEVTNIRYFGSQPWPTPDSLMIGFLADYAGGEVQIQDDELHDARWFSPPDMPQLPPSDSIARKILRWYETEYVPLIRGKRR